MIVVGGIVRACVGFFHRIPPIFCINISSHRAALTNPLRRPVLRSYDMLVHTLRQACRSELVSQPSPGSSPCYAAVEVVCRHGNSSRYAAGAAGTPSITSKIAQRHTGNGWTRNDRPGSDQGREKEDFKRLSDQDRKELRARERRLQASV